MTINTKQLLFILDNTPCEQNILLCGRHGIGKSRILEDYYSSKGMKVVTLFLAQMSDPSDLLGLPEKNKETGKTDFMPPYWFPLDGKPIVLFLDELNRSRPEILNLIMDVTLNRKLAGRSLPAGSRIISAVNSGNEYQLTDLDPALISRWNIYHFSPDVEDWINWANESKLDERVINFIQKNPEFLDGEITDSNAENIERTPDRRSWERVSNIIKNINAGSEIPEEYKPLITGIVGTEATTALFEFSKANNRLSAVQIMNGNFDDFQNQIKEMDITEITNLNTSVFKYFEGVDDSKLNEDQIKMYSENLNKYFDFLPSVSKEYQMHFISLCSAQNYPKALVFFAEKCGNLTEKFIQSI